MRQKGHRTTRRAGNDAKGVRAKFRYGVARSEQRVVLNFAPGPHLLLDPICAYTGSAHCKSHRALNDAGAATLYVAYENWQVGTLSPSRRSTQANQRRFKRAIVRELFQAQLWRYVSGWLAWRHRSQACAVSAFSRFSQDRNFFLQPRMHHAQGLHRHVGVAHALGQDFEQAGHELRGGYGLGL